MTFISRTSNTRDDWLTPLYVINSLGEFDFDPCPSWKIPQRCAPSFPEEGDGLKASWTGRVWLNPPYGAEAKTWLSLLAKHGNGIALIPPRMGAAWFHEIILSKADALYFLKGRISFLHPVGMTPVSGNNADSVLVAFGANNTEALSNCKLGGRLWRLSKESHP